MLLSIYVSVLCCLWASSDDTFFVHNGLGAAENNEFYAIEIFMCFSIFLKFSQHFHYEVWNAGKKKELKINKNHKTYMKMHQKWDKSPRRKLWHPLVRDMGIKITHNFPLVVVGEKLWHFSPLFYPHSVTHTHIFHLFSYHF